LSGQTELGYSLKGQGEGTNRTEIRAITKPQEPQSTTALVTGRDWGKKGANGRLKKRVKVSGVDNQSTIRKNREQVGGGQREKNLGAKKTATRHAVTEEAARKKTKAQVAARGEGTKGEGGEGKLEGILLGGGRKPLKVNTINR